MICPTFSEEKKLWKRGYKFVAGLDEAGRGPLAGPVVAAAVIFGRSDLPGRSDLHNIRDSKQLPAKQREEFYKIITKHPAIKFGVGTVSEKVIDKINILKATKLAMIKAVHNLSSKPYPYLSHGRDKGIGHGYLGGPTSRKIKLEVGPPDIDYLILDGKMELDLPIRQKSIVKADEKVFSCAAASIIAKVTRDRIMMQYHKKYPQYGFDEHKGYGTKLHYRMLKHHGPCLIHRKSFSLLTTS